MSFVQEAQVSRPGAARRPRRVPSIRRWVGGNVWLILTAPAAMFLLVAFAYPMVRVLLRSAFDPGLTAEHYRAMVQVDAYAKVLLTTFRISLVVTLASVVLGYPVAYVLRQAKGIPASLLIAGIVLPLWTTELVRGFAWTVILGRVGPINRALEALGIIDQPLELLFNATAVYIGAVQIMLPFMILPLYSVMRGIDSRLVRAAESLGASPLAAFVHVYLPLSMPGVVSGALLVFVLSTGFYVTPAILGSPNETMIALLIDSQGRRALDWGLASALSVALLVSTVAILAIYNRMFGLDRLPVGGAA